MQFGIFSNGLRHHASAADTYDEDIAEIVAADRLGFHEAWVSEHIGGWLPDVVPNAELLIAKAAGLTKQIKFGPAVRLLPLYHPLDVATTAAMCDHLLRGRYLFGFGTGAPFVNNMEKRGMTNADRPPMMLESIAFIEKCWTAPEPFDWDGTYWKGKNISIRPKPFQQPFPPVAVATSQDSVVRLAASRGWTVISGQFDTPDVVRERGNFYSRAARESGSSSAREKLTVARHIHVSDSIATAKAEIGSDVEKALDDWKRLSPERFQGYLPKSGRVEDVNFESAVDTDLIIAGPADFVYEKLHAFFQQSGGFGTLLIVMGKDWGHLEHRVRSMELFMDKVAPRLAQLDANSVPEIEAAPIDKGDANRKLTAAAY